MTSLTILSPKEQRSFDAPPKFTTDERALYFSLNNSESETVQTLRSLTNKVGFILQLGYFKSHAKFYTADQFRPADITYVTNSLGIAEYDIDLSTYKKKIPHDHRKLILKLLDWKGLNTPQQNKIIEHVKWLVQRQFSLRNIFLSVIDFCWQNKIELPSYHLLSNIIADQYNEVEKNLLSLLAQKLSPTQIETLNALVFIDRNDNKKRLPRSKMTLIKKINQSLKAKDIKENTNVLQLFKTLFNEFKPIIDELNLPDQAVEYFATWVQKSTLFQLQRFPNKNKLYLHLLCYIKHQFYYRQDILIDIFLKSIKSLFNLATNNKDELDKKNSKAYHKTIKTLSGSHKNSRESIEKITNIVKSVILSMDEKLTQIESIVDEFNDKYTPSDKGIMIKMEQSLDSTIQNKDLFDALESVSLKMQQRVSDIVKTVEFNPLTSSTHLTAAINHFKDTNGNINVNPPLVFLKKVEKDNLYLEEKLRVSLYKVLLFVHMADSIKSGHLNLLHSYRYKAIQDYLISKDMWEFHRATLLEQAGLLSFSDFKNTINALKVALDNKYNAVNERFLSNQNPYLKMDKNGKILLSTPAIESDTSKYVSTLLSQSGFVPILQILTDVNAVTDYVNQFKHFSIKHKKMKPSPTTIFAGILGKGCNIGIKKMANISVGVSEDILSNTVKWCFSLKNLQAANNKVVQLISKLSLAEHYRHNLHQLHTGSDGQKVNVGVDCVLASYSFKYFGKGKGVTVYTYMDERQLLFYSTVMSSSEREAAYVIDGLLQNEVVKSDIHSTDTHGYTETIFAATHFINTAFAPRIKEIGKQKIYSFATRKSYVKKGYKLLPSRTINVKLIETYWEDILRFMATIKLKHSSASQLFKRLSSYAKDNPLYKAIKEFGRIIKSIFILTYFDDVELRQRIEKQLNKVELSNKFSKAVFFDNNQEFKQGSTEEQKINVVCKMLIQNAIILWNYLQLSQILINTTDPGERKRMLEGLKKGSVIAWKHVNLQGEYDFTRYAAANNKVFDMKSILAFKVA